jgi:hypothetical protein
MQLKFSAISPYNICADRLGITKTCNRWVASIANWKGKPSHVKENPKQISYYIDLIATRSRIINCQSATPSTLSDLIMACVHSNEEV